MNKKLKPHKRNKTSKNISWFSKLLFSKFSSILWLLIYIFSCVIVLLLIDFMFTMLFKIDDDRWDEADVFSNKINSNESVNKSLEENELLEETYSEKETNVKVVKDSDVTSDKTKTNPIDVDKLNVDMKPKETSPDNIIHNESIKHQLNTIHNTFKII